MNEVLNDLLGKFCLVYLDDIIIFSTLLQEHLDKLQKVFDRLKMYTLKVE